MLADVADEPVLWRRLLPVLVVAVAPLLLFSDATRGRVLLAPGDALLITLPNRELVASYLRAGEWPLWNPFSFSGFPLLAVSQMGVFHPGTWLYLVLPELWATNAQVLATYVVAGLATFACCRSIGCSRFGAMLGGLTFAGSGFMLAHLGHIVVIQAAACLPVVLWCLERVRGGGGWAFVVGGAVAVALAVFAGHPQIPVMVLAAGAAHAAYFTAVDPGRRGRARFAFDAAALLIGGVLLAAVQLIPTAELAAQSMRARLGFDEFASMALPWRQVPTLLLPYLFGGDAGQPYRGEANFFELCGYAGLIPAMLALAALPAALRDRAARFWVLLGATGLLLMLGAQTPLARLAYHVPVWNLFRGAARNALFANLCLAVLAAWSATTVLPRQPGRIALASLLVVGVVAACALAAWSGWVVATPAAVLVPLLLACAGAIALVVAARRPAPASAAAVAALLGLDLFLFAGRMDHILLPAQYIDQPPDYVSWLLAERPQPDAVRVGHLHAGDFLATRSDLGRWRLASITGYEPLMLSRYSEFAADMSFFGSLSDRAVAQTPLFLDLLNTGYLIVELPPPERLAAAGGFAPQPIGADLAAGQTVTLALPDAVPATALDLVTALSGSAGVADDTAVGRVVLTGTDGHSVELPLRAGRETAEWAWGRPDVAPLMRHRQAEVFEPLVTEDFTGARYIARLELGAPRRIASVRFEATVPGVTLSIVRARLRDGATITPLTHAHALFASDRWQVLHVSPTSVLLRNQRAMPRAWLVPAVRALPHDAILAAVRTGLLPAGDDFDPRAVALAEDEAAAMTGAADPAARAEIAAWSPNALTVRTASAEPAFLVLSEIDYPGWQATLDGAAVPIVRTDGVLRGVAVPAGEHRVALAFRPWPPVAGAAVSGATVLAFVAAGVRRRRGGRQAAP